MLRTKPGGARLGVDSVMEYMEHPISGLVATNGVAYSSVATIGTTAVTVLDQLIDPGIPLSLKELEVGFTQKFTGLNGSVGGSIAYYWQVRSETRVPSAGAVVKYTSSYCNVTGSYLKAIGTLIALEDTFSGYVNVGSVPYAPIRILLTAIGVTAANVEGKVKNSTYIRMVGNAIPGC